MRLLTFPFFDIDLIDQMKTIYLKSLLSFCFLIVSLQSFGQSYIGLPVSEYSGVNGVALNPAMFVGSGLKADINLFSGSIYLGNDYVGVDLANLFSSFESSEDVERTPFSSNNVDLNYDILGPSFVFHLNERSSIGLITRARVFGNITNIDGQLLESIIDGFGNQESYSFAMQDLKGDVHGWAEIGLNYGRRILSNGNYNLDGGITLKYLAGIGGLFTNSEQLSGNFDSASGLLSTSGTLTTGNALGFDIDELSFSNITSGFGMDLGAVFEFDPFAQPIVESRYGERLYRMKIGLSVTDLGSINYSGSTQLDYQMNATVDTGEFDEEDFDLNDFLELNYPSTETEVDRTVTLPTGLHFFVDYTFTKTMAVAVRGSFSAREKTEQNANYLANTLSIIPRLDFGSIGIFSPVSFREYDSGLSWGLGFRLGNIITVGSGSLLSNLLSSSSTSTDVFVAAKISLRKKRVKKSEDTDSPALF